MERSMPLTEALYYILLVLGEPLHGYGIIQTVSAITGERVLLGPGTLYGALNTLLEKGWIKLVRADTTARKKKEYIRTEKGRQALLEEMVRLEAMVADGKRVLDRNGEVER